MMEALFGPAAPLWTATPPMTTASQTLFAPAGPRVAPPMFGSSLLPTAPGGAPAPTFASPFAFAPQPGPTFVNPEIGGVSAPALIAAVAVRRGQLQGPTGDLEIEDFVYDAIELLAGTSDIEIRCEAGRVTLTGSVQHKRVKRDVGEVAWATPGVNDVQNTLVITSRRRSRAASRELEPTPAAVGGRKQA